MLLVFVLICILILIYNLVSSRTIVYFRDFFCSKECPSKARLENKTVIITGGNAGIGKETAFELSKRGARIIIACRITKKGEEAAADIRNKVAGADILVRLLDLASFTSVRKFAQDILETESQINILINNAGIGGYPKSTTKDGIEMHFGVNHLGHFLLTNLLLDRIKESVPSRIINVASLAHTIGEIDFDDINYDRNYKPIRAYGRSKLANILFTRELAKHLEGTGVTTYSLHPGAVHTGLGRYLYNSKSKFFGYLYHGCSRLFYKSPSKGVQTIIYCAVDESLCNESGSYYCDCTKIFPSARARDDNLAKTLWEISEKLTTSNSSYPHPSQITTY